MVELSHAEVEALEGQLRQAMLDGDVAVLDALLPETAIFTNQFGAVLGKADDLAAHRSGRLRLRQIEAEELRILAVPGGAVVNVLWRIAGTFDGQPLAGPFRYTRVWTATQEGMRITAAHCSAAA